MLLIVIAALVNSLVLQQRRAARREAELQARLAEHKAESEIMKAINARQYKYLHDKLQKADAAIRDTPKPMVGSADPGRSK